MTIYSYSRLNCFQQCPRKYKFKYIDRMRTKQRETVELFLGKRVHETLWKLYQKVWNHRLIGLDELLDFLGDRWMNHWDESIRIVKSGYVPADYLNLAKRYISDYYQRYMPFNHERTIGLEKRILVSLNDSSHNSLCGFIDRITKTDDGWYQIHEYKTSSHLPNCESLQYNWQTLLYVSILKHRYSYIKKVKVVWHFLKFNTMFNVVPSDDELEGFERDLRLLINRINMTSEFFPHRSSLCRWCEFNDFCSN